MNPLPGDRFAVAVLAVAILVFESSTAYASEFIDAQMAIGMFVVGILIPSLVLGVITALVVSRGAKQKVRPSHVLRFVGFWFSVELWLVSAHFSAYVRWTMRDSKPLFGIVPFAALVSLVLGLSSVWAWSFINNSPWRWRSAIASGAVWFGLWWFTVFIFFRH